MASGMAPRASFTAVLTEHAAARAALLSEHPQNRIYHIGNDSIVRFENKKSRALPEVLFLDAPEPREELAPWSWSFHRSDVATLTDITCNVPFGDAAPIETIVCGALGCSAVRLGFGGPTFGLPLQPRFLLGLFRAWDAQSNRGEPLDDSLAAVFGFVVPRGEPFAMPFLADALDLKPQIESTLVLVCIEFAFFRRALSADPWGLLVGRKMAPNVSVWATDSIETWEYEVRLQRTHCPVPIGCTADTEGHYCGQFEDGLALTSFALKDRLHRISGASAGLRGTESMGWDSLFSSVATQPLVAGTCHRPPPIVRYPIKRAENSLNLSTASMAPITNVDWDGIVISSHLKAPAPSAFGDIVAAPWNPLHGLQCYFPPAERGLVEVYPRTDAAIDYRVVFRDPIQPSQWSSPFELGFIVGERLAYDGIRDEAVLSAAERLRAEHGGARPADWMVLHAMRYAYEKGVWVERGTGEPLWAPAAQPITIAEAP